MFHTIEFGRLSAMLVDFIDHTEGLWFLRLAGPEPTVNAIWARLLAREYRGQKWKTGVIIPILGRSYPERVGLAKQITYRTLRQRLPSGMIDLAMVHPSLTVSEDKPEGFYLLTYESGLPTGFYDRLNACLTIPLKPDWAAWLWTQGQRPLTGSVTAAREPGEREGEVEAESPAEITVTPIVAVTGLGSVACYQVKTGDRYKEAWLAVIRDQLAWGSGSGNPKE
ncbi:MAG: hypothetical protein KDJ97_38525 [Anaerolineae bacterium]|nr:hypothetical protein [Anaerolineae bacterium]